MGKYSGTHTDTDQSTDISRYVYMQYKNENHHTYELNS